MTASGRFDRYVAVTGALQPVWACVPEPCECDLVELWFKRLGEVVKVVCDRPVECGANLGGCGIRVVA